MRAEPELAPLCCASLGVLMRPVDHLRIPYHYKNQVSRRPVPAELSTIPEEMGLSIGQILRGRKGTYRLIEALKAPTVFKAQVLPSSSIKADLYGSLNVLKYLD